MESKNEQSFQSPTPEQHVYHYRPQSTLDRELPKYLPLLFAGILVIGILLGFQLYENLRGKQQLAYNTQIPEIEEVLRYIDEKYVDEISSETLIEDVIEQALHKLDPHSNYIPARELQEVQESLRGNFEGIGIEFSLVKDTIIVVTPIAGGPSAQLGIQAGDKIIEIEDTLVAGIGITNDEVVEKLRGEKGTTVNVSIYRKGVDELLQYPIKRDKIPLISVDVSYMLDKEVGYIKITRFSATTYEEFIDALEKLQEAGMKKLIVDLRENPGGYLNAAVNIADEFIDGRNMLVYTEGENYKRKEYFARRYGRFEQGDLVILINEGSASASEIVSGAVQDWDRGKIIGRRSFGKGLVQEQYRLSNGSALRLTIARYYTPVGRCIQKPYDEGVTAYYEELNQRLEDGTQEEQDSTEVADSLTYKTLIEERIVYGGGGISPDIFVELDTSGMESFLIKTRSLIPEFIYSHFSNEQQTYQRYASFEQFQRNFQVSDELLAQFKTYVKTQLDFVDEKLFDRDHHEIALYMKAYLARQLWSNDGFYPVIHKLDEGLQKAYSEIKSGRVLPQTAKK